MPAARETVARAVRELLWFAAVAAALCILFAAAATLDGRALANGEGVWLKPIRFSLAFAVHAATLAWLAHLTAREAAGDRLFAASARLQIAVMVMELGCIGLQAGRGVASHFNYETPFDRAVFTVMGLGTAGLFVGFLLIMAGLMRSPRPVLAAWATGIAMGFASLGGLTGVAMVMPTAEQAALLDAGLRPGVIGNHLVGVAAGGKVPFFHWDLIAGDWRVPHFLGLHAMQALPFVAWLGERARSQGFAVLGLTTLGYGVLFAWACLKTVSGQSAFALAAGDFATVAAGAGLYLYGIAVALRLRAPTTRALNSRRRSPMNKGRHVFGRVSTTLAGLTLFGYGIAFFLNALTWL
jgi:hypothetical protein